jgi:CRISPR/Cas system CSM-associated protein Csm5 (group 7 of RAMP superfamily)
VAYVYDFITKLCGKQAEVVQNHYNRNVRNTGQGEAQQRKYKTLKLGGSQAYDPSSDNFDFECSIFYNSCSQT